MFKESFKKHKGIVVSTTAFMLFFLGYLFVNSVVQNTALKAANYSSYLGQLSLNSAQLNGSAPPTSSLVTEGLDILEQGGQVQLQDGVLIDLEPLDQILQIWLGLKAVLAKGIMELLRRL